MKLTLLKRKIQAYHLGNGLWALAISLLLASASLVQATGTMITFVSNRDWDWKKENAPNVEIHLIDPNGKDVRQLTDASKYDSEPAWSPNGKQISFMSYRDLEQLPKDEIRLGEIYVMNADGSNPINLTRSPERPDGVSSWSPDGKQIAFSSAELFNEHILANSDIFVMDTDGANPINLTNHEAQDQTPDWSPDGLRIAFSSLRDGNWEIYVMNPDGANPINLTNHLAKDGRPDWSPDGNQITFTSDRDGNLEIYVMSANGANPINITNHPDWDRGPSWGPAPTLSVPSNERLATLWGKVKRINTYGVK